MSEPNHPRNDDDGTTPRPRGWWTRTVRGLSTVLEIALSVVGLVADLLLFLVGAAVLLLVALPWNLWKYGESILRGLWRLILGKAIIQKRLEGLILEAKLDVLRIGLELEKLERERVGRRGPSDGSPASDAPERSRTDPSVEWVETFKTAIGFDEPVDRGYELWIPGREWLERKRERLRERWERLPHAWGSVPVGDGPTASDGRATRPDGGAEARREERGGTEPSGDPNRASGDGTPASTNGTDGPLSRDVQWAALTMELLNEAESHLERNVETALRTYLRVDRLLVDGEHRLHTRRKEREERSDSSAARHPVAFARRAWDGFAGERRNGTDHHREPDDPVGVRARVALHRAKGLDSDARTVVRELLCGATGRGANGSTGSGTTPGEPEESGGDSTFGEEPKPSLSVTELDKALGELNRHRLEEYRRLESLRITVLSFVGVPALLIGLVLFYFPSFMQGALEPVRDELAVDMVRMPLLELAFTPHTEQLFFALVLVFGALGAAISGTQKVQHDSESLEYLQDILGYWLALVRMLIGAISAFIVAIFLLSGAIDGTYLTLPLIFGTSIAAGFSERFALRAITSFETRTMPKSISRKREAVV